MHIVQNSRFRVGIALLCAILLCLMPLHTLAEDSVDTLEQQTISLQNEIDALNTELTNMQEEIDSYSEQIRVVQEDIRRAELDIASAVLSEDLQYQSMKKRIKYVYENGSTNLLALIFSSKSMTDFLNRSEFVRNISDYDRKMLTALQDIHNQIEQQKAALEAKQSELESLQASLAESVENMNALIDEKHDELAASEIALAAAREAQARAAAAAAEAAAAATGAGTAEGGDSSGGSDNWVTVVGGTSSTDDEYLLFAAILQCEAGASDYAALLAVATVIMNRVESGHYPNTITDVIYQRGQFSPTWNGSLTRRLNNGVADICFEVARDAINGNRLTDVIDCYSFRASYTGHWGTVIGGNVFF